MIQIEFIPWKRFAARKQPKVIRRWLSNVSRTGKRVFKEGLTGPHSGRIYRRRGGVHQASVNRTQAEYPASDSGALLASLRARANGTREAVIGTNVYYSRFLREGTRKMKRRKMSDDALKTAAAKEKKTSRGWVRWQKSKRNR